MSRFSFMSNDLVYHLQQLVQQPAARRTATYAGSTIGFTIVELLIVIVVIGILASIVIVAFNGVSNQASNTAKISELKALGKLYDLYKAQNGEYPQQSLATSSAPTANPVGNTYPFGYCIATGYPNAGTPSLPSCYSMTTSSTLTYTYRENDATAATIRSELATVGKVPSSVRDFRVNNVMGPVAFYYTDRIYLVTVIKADTINDCPGGTERHYPSLQSDLESQNGRLECRLRFMK